MRIAIIGGTFDPIHNGHLSAAQSVVDTLQVDEVHFVPAFSPPHKASRGMTSPFHRFAMVALAAAPVSRFITSTVEVDALQKRYTVETLELMGQMYPGAELLFVAGTDMYQEIESWKNFKRLFELAHLVVINRPGYPFREDTAPFTTLEPNTMNEFRDGGGIREIDVNSSSVPKFVSPAGKKSVFYLPFVEHPASSTEIRAEVREARKRGEKLMPWLPPQVWSYIEKNNLYA